MSIMEQSVFMLFVESYIAITWQSWNSNLGILETESRHQALS